MEDQTNLLRKFGILAGSIREDKALELRTEKEQCSVLFSSPESLLGNDRWPSILSSDAYKKNLIGIVVEELKHIVLTIVLDREDAQPVHSKPDRSCHGL